MEQRVKNIIDESIHDLAEDKTVFNYAYACGVVAALYVSKQLEAQQYIMFADLVTATYTERKPEEEP